MTIWGKILESITILTPILVAIITAGGAYMIKLHMDNKGLKQKVHDLSFGLVFNLMTLNDITHIVGNMFNLTPADRFVILTANNGKTHFRAANAIYEQHNTSNGMKTYLSLGLTERYKDFEFDEHYRGMLKQTEKEPTKGISFKTSEMVDCDLKSIYISEKVTESIIFFISRKAMDSNNDRLFYCSVATHNPGGFSKDNATIIKSYTDQIKAKLREE